MKNYELLDAIGGIDAKYVENATRKRKSKRSPIWIKIIPVAACFFLTALISFGILHNGMLPSDDPVANNEKLEGQPTGYYEWEDGQEIQWEGNSISTPTRTDHLAEDILLEAQLQGGNNGVAVPIFIAYNGAIYGGTDYDMSNAYVSVSETEVEFNPDYTYTAYQVTDHPELVAIIINGGYMVYEKMIEVSVTIDGNLYQVECPVFYLTMDAVGEQIFEADGIKVYEAIDVTSQDKIDGKYIVDITERMSAVCPNFFSDPTENYADGWWVVKQAAK